MAVSKQTFFWYDLETSGINPREARIMQFAGQRTDMDLQLVGEPVNVLIKLTEDVLPDPEAILITGITPQQTLSDGITEAEFLKLFHTEIATPGTIFAGYNTVRFDDEFMRCLNYRNFYDPYQWLWQDGRSRWDLLDVVRMTRALRPDGIKWPVVDGKPTNRLELLTGLNGLDHEHAHDALNDVLACIAFAKLIREKQPKLFDTLLSLRDKKAVKQFLDENPTFIYTSGKYANEVEKTAVVYLLHKGDDREGAIVYDLRHDPAEFAQLSPEELVERWRWTNDPEAPKRLPVKTLKYNHCPAITKPGLVGEPAVQERLKVSVKTVEKNRAALRALPNFIENIVKARDLMDDERGERWSREKPSVDARLYDGFLNDADCRLLDVVRAAEPDELAQIGSQFHDDRMQELLPLYKARNFTRTLTDEERAAWEKHRHEALLDGGTESRLAKFMHRLGELAKTETKPEKRYLLEELQLYAESIMPVLDTDL